MTQKERRSAATSMLQHLEAGETTVEWHPALQEPSGIIALGWPKYPEWLYDGLWSATLYLEHSERFDRDAAMAIYGELFNGEVEHDYGPQSHERLWAELTYVLRGERFCDGHIDTHLKDGSLLSLMKAFAELA
ncbi:hypothetical protein JKI95_03750 [Corynebacterium aquatimens]|uniref:DUF6508 domain-containing protein n=2 Tax=Corynebacterium TaxID=1716 RepID=UPI00253F6EA9|nr:DUF6508 domain-containing protein [Corynebacterium aquatimens]QYH20117.1 hypothetical protein JKI95_03750 [Corynebacterium aquatimens]